MFAWWALTITAGILFLIAVSAYLYALSGRRRGKGAGGPTHLAKMGNDFVFVWSLLGLLALYIVSIGNGSPILFACGNIVVEAILIFYIVRNRAK